MNTSAIETELEAHNDRMAARHCGELDQHDAMIERAEVITKDRMATLKDDDLIAGFHSAVGKDAATIRAAWRDDAQLAAIVRRLVELEIARDSRDQAENEQFPRH